MHSNTASVTEREDGLPDRLRAMAADEIEGRQPVLSPGNSHDLLTAADEIERLREAIRRLAEQDATLSVQGGNVTVTIDAMLTDAEREAVETAFDAMQYAADELGLSQADCDRLAATLRGLLPRHFPVPENQPSQDNTPPAHSNQSEASVRPECAAWMTRPFYVDPAAGWSYGFPKLYDPATDGDMTAWLIANGYPRYLADQNLPITFTAQID